MLFEHVIHRTGHLVSGGDEGLCWYQAPLQPSVKGSQGAVDAQNGLGRHAEGLGGTVAGFHRAVFQHLAAGDLIFGGQTKQGTEVFLVRPLAHIGADFRGYPETLQQRRACIKQLPCGNEMQGNRFEKAYSS